MKALPLGIRISTYVFRGTQSIQTIAGRKGLLFLYVCDKLSNNDSRRGRQSLSSSMVEVEKMMDWEGGERSPEF